MSEYGAAWKIATLEIEDLEAGAEGRNVSNISNLKYLGRISNCRARGKGEI